MRIEELLNRNNVTISVTAADLKEFALYIIEKTKLEHAEHKQDKLLTVNEAANMLGVSKNTLWRWNRDGYLRNKKIGRNVFYHQSEIDRIL